MSDFAESLTDEERWRLLNPHQVSFADSEDHLDEAIDGTPVTCHRCHYAWLYTGSATTADCPNCRARTHISNDTLGAPRGVTLEQCNAIREAAHDGLSYGSIANLFSFISSRSTASKHARGDCQHGRGDVPPVAKHRTSTFGPDHEAVDAKTCRELRERWSDGQFDTYTEAAEWADCFRTTASNHINGRCQHGGDTQP